MTLFAETLATLLDEEGLNQETLCHRSGISRATLSRTLQGHTPSCKGISAIIQAISRDKGTRLKLLLAHLHDVAASCSVDTDIQPHEYVISHANRSHSKLSPPPNLHKEFHLIAEDASTNEDMRDLIRSVARLIELNKKPNSQAYIPLGRLRQPAFSGKGKLL